MKPIFLLSFACLFFTQKPAAQSLVFQDTTFTEPVILTDLPDGVTFEGCHFVGITADAALTLVNVRHVSIASCTFENIQGNAVLVTGVQGSETFYMLRDTINNVHGAGVVIRKGGRVEFFNSLFANISHQAIDIATTRRVEVSRNQLHHVGSGISCFGSGKVDSLRIFGTSIRSVNGLPGEPESGNGIRVANTGLAIIDLCTVDSCMGTGVSIGQGNSDSTAVDSVVIRHNTIGRTNFDGVRGEGNAYHGYIHNNEISYPGLFGGHPNAGDHGIRWQGPNCRIEDNHVHHAVEQSCGQAYCGSGISIRNSGVVARNRIHDCSNNGIRYSNDQLAPQQDLFIYNNIVYDVENNPILIQGNGDQSGEPAHILIRNNTLLGIFHGNALRSAPLAVCYNTNEVTAQGNLLLFEDMADTSQFVQMEGTETLTENFNRKATDSLGFVDYAGRDFHLTAASAAIDFLPLHFGEPTDDFDREPRDLTPDAGADEFPAPAPDFCGCVNCPQFIPDNFTGDFFYYVVGAANDDLATSTQGICGVRLHFDHEYLGDLTMILTSPTGQAVTLVGPAGFFGATDGASWDVLMTPCADPAAPDPGFSAVWTNNQFWEQGNSYAGTYYPAAGCLEQFNTGPVSGVWRLAVTDSQADDVGNFYNFEILFCDTTGITCLPCLAPPVAGFTVITNGWNVFYQNSSTNAVSYHLDFGDSLSFSGATLPTSLHTYADTGTYLLRLIVNNVCGVDTFERTVHIAGVLPAASAFAQPTSGCAPLSVGITTLTTGRVDVWHWLLPGGVPAESFEQNPTVVYSAPGTYSATLIISNPAGSDTLDYPAFVRVDSNLVTPGFTVQVQGDSIIATNTTQGFTGFYWLLNDELIPGNVFPDYQVYVVDTSGTYLVTLYVANACGNNLIEQAVAVTLSGLKNAEKDLFEQFLLPNPSDGQGQLVIVSPENFPANMVVLNAVGQAVMSQKTNIVSGENARDLDLRHLPNGLYLLRLQTAAGSKTIPFILQK